MQLLSAAHQTVALTFGGQQLPRGRPVDVEGQRRLRHNCKLAGSMHPLRIAIERRVRVKANLASDRGRLACENGTCSHAGGCSNLTFMDG